MDIDVVPTLEMLQMINNEDKKAAYCVEKHLPEIAAAVETMSVAFAQGGRIVYCGAGTSGRMGFMDSAECPPTFGVARERVVALLAGGKASIAEAKEGSEDSREMCVFDLKEIDFSGKDILVGIAASGRTPYVVGGLEYAGSLGALTVSVTCNENEDCEINRLARCPIAIYAGPEAVTGSTRMKAGTVQKMVLNMLSTGVMIKTGKLYSNLMVNVQVSNEKLMDRAARIIEEITAADGDSIARAMEEAGNKVSLAIFMLLTGLGAKEAEAVLAGYDGHIKKALQAIN